MAKKYKYQEYFIHDGIQYKDGVHLLHIRGTKTGVYLGVYFFSGFLLIFDTMFDEYMYSLCKIKIPRMP